MTSTDKFGQAICAFANDLPNHRASGYLFLGVTDDGAISDINVTDELLKNIAATRTDGNIQPQPSFPNLMVQNVYQAIKMNRKAKYSQLEDNLGVSESTILRAIGRLKENGHINSQRSKVVGEWQLLI